MKEIKIYDNSMLSDYKRCPRYFYYRHELGWTSERKSPALCFGSAWHAAMEVIWGNFTNIEYPLDEEELIREAHLAFKVSWVNDGMPSAEDWTYELEQEYSPRTPGRALEMLVAYIKHRFEQRRDFEIISMEKPFAVPLDPTNEDIFYVGKIDKIVRRHGKLLGIEHKTSSAYAKNGIFRGGFVDSFSPNSQVDGYLYALHLLFPGQVGGVWVDAALVHKEVEGFLFIPVEKRLEHLESWLWEVRWWIEMVERERGRLKFAAPTDSILTAFPKNTNSCWDFHAACPYLEMCKSWTNPVGKSTPLGYKVDRWSPLAHIQGLQDPRSVKLKDLRGMT